MSEETSLVAYVDPDQIKADLHIDLTNINEAMAKHASTFLHYAGQSVRAKRQFERYKLGLEVLEAKLDAEWRTTLKGESAKSTEPAIRAAIVQDSRYKQMSARMIEAQQVHRLAEAAERAFEHRKDMLLQIARDAARESGGQLRVTANQANKDRLLEVMGRNAEGKAAA
jgi:hypothetical protein